MLNTEEGQKFELSVVDGLLQEDLRNNSAWNHRWFVLHSSLASGETLPEEVRGVVVVIFCCCCCLCCWLLLTRLLISNGQPAAGSNEPLKNKCRRGEWMIYVRNSGTFVPSAAKKDRSDNPDSNTPDNHSADKINQTVKVELAYAFGFAERAPSNESPWNYMRGFFRAGGWSYAGFPEVKERALALQVSLVLYSCGAGPTHPSPGLI